MHDVQDRKIPLKAQIREKSHLCVYGSNLDRQTNLILRKEQDHSKDEEMNALHKLCFFLVGLFFFVFGCQTLYHRAGRGKKKMDYTQTFDTTV